MKLSSSKSINTVQHFPQFVTNNDYFQKTSSLTMKNGSDSVKTSEESSISAERFLNFILFLLAVAVHTLYQQVSKPTQLLSNKLSLLSQQIQYQNQLPTLFTRTKAGYADRRTHKTGKLPITGTLERFL